MDTKKDINIYLDPQFLNGANLECETNTGCGCGPPAQNKSASANFSDDLNDFVGSFQIYAIKA
jgi:arsenite methyltransferase